jgi:orotidine-5'-phosphate decarboxylase
LPFAEIIHESSNRIQSRIVLALDIENGKPQAIMKKCNNVLEDVAEDICAVKVNRQLVLSLGLPMVSQLVRNVHEHSLPVVMDAKLNDVGHTNAFMMRSFMRTGFDAIIASPVTGWKDGLDIVFELGRKDDKGIILLVYMSNPGAEQFYSVMVSTVTGQKPIFECFTQMAVEWGADGIVVGATRPDIIRRVRSLVGPSMGIYSPGIGAQGGNAKKAIESGATYLIVGRTIYASPKPRDAARAINESIR